jgi:hypothetical protein
MMSSNALQTRWFFSRPVAFQVRVSMRRLYGIDGRVIPSQSLGHASAMAAASRAIGRAEWLSGDVHEQAR